MLGIVWNYLTDEFSFKVKVDLPRLTDHSVPRLTDHSVDLGIKMAKRTLLSQVARFYDPIGFAAALICLHWDDELPRMYKKSGSSSSRK